MKLFDSIAINKPKLNKFDLSFEHKLSMKMGDIVPIYNEEVLPSDRFQVNSEIFIRFAPMLAPIMHRINAYVHYFYVPNRIIWDSWQDFITGGTDGTSEPIIPYIRMETATRAYFNKKRLPDRFGITPMSQTGTLTDSEDILALQFRAYAEIFNEYYVDQNVGEKIEFSKGSGRITDTQEINDLTSIRKRAWEKDYFTSALPWTQRGPEVTIPADVNYMDVSVAKTSGGDLANTQRDIAHNPLGNLEVEGPGGVQTGRIENIENLGLTINDLRQSNRLQQWLEKNARGGARYVEQILSHFGVLVPDSRLQRPEYLGGGRANVVISEVLNSTGPTADPEGADWVSPQGGYAGHGISVGNTNRFSRRFTEHGQIIGLLSVLPKTAYQNGIPRQFSRTSKFDYYFKEFAHLGEQAIQNREIYTDFTGTPGSGKNTWAYQSRYAEYKSALSRVSGDFRDTLSYWQMGRQFSSLPPFNENFVKADPTKRIFAVEDQEEDELYVQAWNNVRALRPMPYHATPSL